MTFSRKLLQGVTEFAGPLDTVIDQFIQSNCPGSGPQGHTSDTHSAATMAVDPAALDEILIALADSIVVDIEADCQRSDTRQLLCWAKFSGSDKEHNLLRQLLVQRDIAALAQ
jgi:hypothetical protein